MSRAFYPALAELAAPALRLYLAARARRGKENPVRLSERRGRASATRPAGALLWVHAASLGETRSVLPLLARLREMRADLSILLTTFTVTPARLVEEQKDPRLIHQFVPLDVPHWAARFLDHWRPDAAIWVEGELWPNLIAASAARGMPMALVNARLSGRSFSRWSTAGRLFPAPLDPFVPCLAQSEGDAERLRHLGADGATFVGNLKFDGPPLAVDPAELARLREALGDRPLWLAASTHPGEEMLICAVHRKAAPRHPRLLTIIVPRHAARGAEIERELAAASDIAVRRRSLGALPDPQTAIYIADTMGELGVFYRLAGLAFVGGSLVPHGGQNPLEAARLDCAVLFGPHMNNFRDIADALLRQGGAHEVRGPDDLATEVARLLDDRAECVRRAAAAAAVAEAGRGAVERVLAALEPLLARLPRAAHENALARA